MRVLFLLQGERTPSSRLRVLDHVERLKGKGLAAEVRVLPKPPWERWRTLREAGRFDLAFVQKKVLRAWELAVLRAANPRFVFDFDDAIMYPATDPSRRGKRASAALERRRYQDFRRMIQGCRAVIAGNEFLRARAIRYNPRVYLIPTPIDTDRFSYIGPKNDGEEVVIGWYGSPGNLPYLDGLRKVLGNLTARYPGTSVKVVSQAFPNWPEVPLLRKFWKEEEEVEDIGTFDVGIMPLGEDLWSRGKCGNKLLLCLARGIPAVATDTEANRAIIENGVNGFLAGSSQQWTDRLSQLIEDALLRRQMGRAGRKKMEEVYSYHVLSPRFKQVLEEVSGGEKGRE